MANLLDRRSDRDGGRAERSVDGSYELLLLPRIAERVGDLVGRVERGRDSALDRAAANRWLAHSDDDLALDLEELEQAPDRLAAEAVVEAIAQWRRRVGRQTGDAGEEGAVSRPAGIPSGSGAPKPAHGAGAGAFVCHRPGRSLSTGEAEIASRGYFDVRDRPPIATWIGVLARRVEYHAPRVEGQGDDFWIVAWVAPDDRERALAGCRACRNSALESLEALAPQEAESLRAALPDSVGHAG